MPNIEITSEFIALGQLLQLAGVVDTGGEATLWACHGPGGAPVAALRSGVKTVLIPKENVRDLKEIPEIVNISVATPYPGTELWHTEAAG